MDQNGQQYVRDEIKRDREEHERELREVNQRYIDQRFRDFERYVDRRFSDMEQSVKVALTAAKVGPPWQMVIGAILMIAGLVALLFFVAPRGVI